MIPDEMKVVLLIIVMLLAASGLGYCHHRGVVEGQSQVIEADKRAVAEQAEKDAKATAKMASNYEAELDRLRAAVPLRPTPVRVCSTPRSSSPTPVVARTSEEITTPGGSIPAVSTSPTAGPDIGPELQQFALRADELSAQVRALLAREKDL